MTPSGQYISRGRGPFVPTMIARARLFSSVTGIRLFKSVISSTRALRAPNSVTRPTTPSSSSATCPRVIPLSGPTASSTARAYTPPASATTRAVAYDGAGSGIQCRLAFNTLFSASSASATACHRRRLSFSSRSR